MPEQRTIVKKSDLWILGLLALACAAALGYFQYKNHSGPRENYAVLQVDNTIVAGYDLREHHAHEIVDLAPYGFPGKLEFQDGAVRFIEVDCPDKICESAGFISGELQSAVCLPNRAALLIYTPEEYDSLRP